MFVLSFLFSCLGWGGEVGAATINAASCSQADVQAAVTSANAGDTVVLPACGETQWSGAITVSKGITIKGAGIDATTISRGGRAIHINNSSSDLVRLTDMTFKGGSSGDFNGVVYVERAEGKFRIDHCKFTNLSGRGIGVGDHNSPDGNFQVYGLIDNCTFTDVNEHLGILIDSDDVGEWARPARYGTGDFVYIEDCTFTYDMETDGKGIIDGNYGSRAVFRYNTVTNGSLDWHGDDGDPADEAGGHTLVVYENTFTITGSESVYTTVHFRGGTGIFFNNQFVTEGGGYLNNPIILRCYRGHVASHCYGSSACDGDHPADGNVTADGWPCDNQTGITSDLDGDGLQDRAPLFEWNNTCGGTKNINRKAGSSIYFFAAGPVGTCNSQVKKVQQNRDYFDDVPGSISNPFNTQGTYAYEGAWHDANGNGMFDVSPAETLYRAEDLGGGSYIYDEYYTPYQYPHPLRGNSQLTVNAGPDLYQNTPSNLFTLVGTINDDGSPAGATVTSQWTQVSGPATASLHTPAQAVTDVTLPLAGTYLFRLTADDSENVRSDDVQVDLAEPVSSQTLTFSPVQDAYVQGATGYNDASLKVENQNRTSYLMFTVAGVSGTVVDARLIMKVEGDSGDGTIRCHAGSHTDWEETALTPATAPAKGTELHVAGGGFTVGSVHTWDVADSVSGNGAYSFVMSQDAGGNDAWFSSREGSMSPVLELDIVVESLVPAAPTNVRPLGEVVPPPDP